MTHRAARDQIMLVSENPPTLGHQRLVSQSAVYPELKLFLSSRGEPDFLAETSNDGLRYFILYFLDRGQAFAARTRREAERTLEFAGPYPMTDREKEMLGEMKRAFETAPPG